MCAIYWIDVISWILYEGYCPLYNSKALKLDTEKCQDGCPKGNYRSFDVYKCKWMDFIIEYMCSDM